MKLQTKYPQVDGVYITDNAMTSKYPPLMKN